MAKRWISPAEHARRLVSRLPAGLVKACSWGLVDQAIISGTNFVTMIVAARVLGPATFGVFAILLTVLTFMESTQRSLITTPHNVLGVSKNGRTYQTYTSSAGLLQLGMALTFGGLSLLAGLVLITRSAELGLMVLAMSLAAFGWQCQEFTRRVLYTESRISAAVVVDGSTYLVRIGLVAGLALSGILSGPALMLAFGATWLMGTATGLWAVRGSLSLSFDRSVVAEHWHFGRWLFASNTVSHIPRYAVTALLSTVLSVAAFGAYRAFEQLANASNVPLTALGNVLRPRFAREAQNGPDAVSRLMMPIILGGTVVLVLFAVFLIAFRDPLVGLVYGQEYVAFTAAMALVAVRPLLTLLKSTLTKALQAVRDTRAVFIGTTGGAVAGTLGGGALILGFGLPAAGSVMVLSGLVSSAWLAWVWRQHLADEVRWQSKLSQKPTLAPPD